jgi:seryl-tRNA(Sec) selenium transferase
MLGRSSAELRVEAEQLAASLDQRGVVVEVVASQGQVGGGALPGSLLPGWAVRIVGPAGFPSISKKASTRLFLALLHGQPAVLGVLREGRVVLDVRCLDRDAVDRVADAVKIAVNGCSGK